MYVPPQRVQFLRLFGLKTGVDFLHFGLESGMVFEETTVCMNVFIVSIPNEWENDGKYSLRWVLRHLCCWLYNVSNDIIS